MSDAFIWCRWRQVLLAEDVDIGLSADVCLGVEGDFAFLGVVGVASAHSSSSLALRLGLRGGS